MNCKILVLLGSLIALPVASQAATIGSLDTPVDVVSTTTGISGNSLSFASFATLAGVPTGAVLTGATLFLSVDFGTVGTVTNTEADAGTISVRTELTAVFQNSDFAATSGAAAVYTVDGQEVQNLAGGGRANVDYGAGDGTSFVSPIFIADGPIVGDTLSLNDNLSILTGAAPIVFDILGGTSLFTSSTTGGSVDVTVVTTRQLEGFITYEYETQTTAVPLPASALLLIAGLGLLFTTRISGRT
ncbi:hypothetical protein [Roseovarius aestuariivivens]|uniref:hypothetical protein n=1 Tax=Roseovarius aestuariivivens TaxID=1888910 RepID=UPI0010804FDE|nr:hypothetical protein [Roseovarius aestuariivivens]